MTELSLPAAFSTGEILTRAAPVGDIDAEKRLVDVRVMRYENENEIDEGLFELFSRGSLKAACSNPSRVKISNQGHDRSMVIGQAVELREEADEMVGTLKIADTSAGRDVLTLLRERMLEELSIEFRPMSRYMKVTRSAKGLHVRHDRAVLVGLSPVRAGAHGDGSRVLATREEMKDRQRERVIAELAAMQAGTSILAGLR